MKFEETLSSASFGELELFRPTSFAHVRALTHRYNFLRWIVGSVAIALPIFVVLGGRLFFDDQLRGSISDYYYSGTRSFFVGFLFILAVFFGVYGSGLEGEHGDATPGTRPHKRLFWLTNFAALFALAVAICPTPSNGSAAQGSSAVLGAIHGMSAALLFGILAIICVWFWHDHKRLSSEPDGRSNVYAACAAVIVLCVGAAAIMSWKHRPILWPEIGAVAAFAVSWMTRGFDQPSRFTLPRAPSQGQQAS
jgi:hypothetical protein